MNHGHTVASLIAFEDLIKMDWEEGKLPYLLHLCGGNEQQLIEIFDEAEEGDWFFVSHRNHYHSLLARIPKLQVWNNIHEGGSMFSYSRERRVFSSAILAGNCGIAVGVAMALKAAGSANKVWCFLGDGAEENGSFYEAVLYSDGHNLPVFFIIEDNGMQVDTPKLLRRGTSLGLLDDEYRVRRYRYKPTYPHAGSACAHKITFKTKS
jgi:TPP-dependent pyruvate/acetoin dehydrogenase alpha subunit